MMSSALETRRSAGALRRLPVSSASSSATASGEHASQDIPAMKGEDKFTECRFCCPHVKESPLEIHPSPVPGQTRGSYFLRTIYPTPL